jgi:hypothetical protein
VGIIGKRVGRGNRKKTNFGHTLHVSACHTSYRDAPRSAPPSPPKGATSTHVTVNHSGCRCRGGVGIQFLIFDLIFLIIKLISLVAGRRRYWIRAIGFLLLEPTLDILGVVLGHLEATLDVNKTK